MMLSGWTWVAAGSLVGFEMLEIIFGSLILMPEVLPLVIIALAVVYFLKERIRSLAQSVRVRLRGCRHR